MEDFTYDGLNRLLSSTVKFGAGSIRGLLAAAITGGTVSVLGGGKFGNGALTSAIIYTVNASVQNRNNNRMGTGTKAARRNSDTLSKEEILEGLSTHLSSGGSAIVLSTNQAESLLKGEKVLLKDTIILQEKGFWKLFDKGTAVQATRELRIIAARSNRVLGPAGHIVDTALVYHYYTEYQAGRMTANETAFKVTEIGVLTSISLVHPPTGALVGTAYFVAKTSLPYINRSIEVMNEMHDTFNNYEAWHNAVRGY